MSNPQLVMYEEEFTEINEVIERLLKEANAKVIFLVDKNGQLILTGRGSDAMDDQWQALQWLINHSLQQGYRLEAGQLFITGALGKMLTAELGDYRASFGELGELRFTIQ